MAIAENPLRTTLSFQPVKGMLMISSPVLERNLSIKNGEVSTDEQLALRVHNFLRMNHLLNGTRLRVDAEQGVVTLRGAARSFYQKQLWLSGAKHVAGVAGIVDDIEVLPTQPS